MRKRTKLGEVERGTNIILTDYGDPVEKFGAGDQPAAESPEMNPKQRMMFFKRKRYVPVVIEIRTEGPMEMSRLEDRFTIWVDSSKIEDNTTVLRDKMNFFTEHIKELVTRWTTELKG